MAAEVHLDFGSKPPKIEVLAAGHDERGFGEVVLPPDGLQRFIGKSLRKDHDRSRIAAEELASESVELKDR